MKIQYPFLYEWTLVILLAGWMIFPNITGLLCGFFFVVVIVGLFLKQLVFRPHMLLGGMFLFFPFYLLYAFNTPNAEEALFAVEKKMSFVLFPLVFSFVPKFPWRIIRFENAFLISLFAIVLICFGTSFVTFLQSNSNPAYLFSSHFSGRFHHPTYLAMFCALGVYLLFTRWQQASSFRNRSFFALGMLILAYTHLHLESLSGILFLAFLLLFLISKWLYNTKGWGTLLLFFSLGTVSIFLLALLVPTLQRNVKDSLTFVSNYVEDPYVYTHTPRGEIRGNDVRLILWTASIEILCEHPNGVGVGNLPKAMESKLLEYGQLNLAKEHLNPHNQYLHTAIETGWFGMCWLILLLAGLIGWGIRNRNYLLVVGVSAFAFNGLFESMMERQSGIVFWLLWSCLLICYSTGLKSIQHET